MRTSRKASDNCNSPANCDTSAHDDYNTERNLVQLVIDGNQAAVLGILDRKSLPARLKEIQLLLDSGYIPEFDNAAQIIHWTSP